MKNMNVLSAACSVSASQSSNAAENLMSFADNSIENKAKPDGSNECHLSEKLLQFHFHQVDSALITSLIPSLTIAAFLWFSLTSHRIFHKPPVPKRRRHLELCTFHE
ncbi:hypothetical protein [Vibrio algivorus]|uniref:Uncharacterized protein n=1 Tax=Vibrio algivorus TaxID=1667024 RepID=A0A557P0X0_9VIBR|nr:hypothetical protein [Vibrio algivorus]TVO34318.1 hypothetical protein FOF44_13780 [Vibrio algivorus]